VNPRFAAVEPSLIREINRRKQPGDIDLGLGEPVLRPDMAPLQRALQWISESGCPYTANPGDPALRAAVSRCTGVPDVVVTLGSQEAVYVALRVAVDPAREEVLIVEPAYPAYAKICEVEAIPYRVAALSADHGFAPRAEPVIRALTDRTALVVLSSPCNPSGRVWPRGELEKLAEALPDGCRVLSDEVYRELYYEQRPTSMAEVFDRTLVAGGLSKSHALTGLRVGWLCVPPDLVTAATRAHQLIATAASTFSQRVALEILQEGSAPHRAIYRDRQIALIEALDRTGLHYVRPEGAFYCLVRIPDRSSSLAMSLRLLEEAHVVTVPGVAFGQSCEGWLRISWVGDPTSVAEGVARIAASFEGNPVDLTPPCPK
jgi:aspartate/methionine/tyrosine aminotransferase